MQNKVHPIFTALLSFTLVGCMFTGLVAHASDVGTASEVKSFIIDYQSNAERLVLSVYRACNDGDITEVDKKALAALLVQDSYLNTVTGGISGSAGTALSAFSHAEDVAAYLLGIPDEPTGETVVSPSTVYSGFYHLSGDTNNYICNLYSGGSVFCSSSHFMYKVDYVENVSSSEPFVNVGYGQIGTTFRTNQSSWQSGYISDAQNYLGGIGISFNVNNPVSMNCRFTTDYIPTIGRGYQYCTAGAPGFICGSGVAVSDPGGVIDNAEPWNYYNNTIVPYLTNNFGADVTPYILYPDGYFPEQPTTDPTELSPLVPETIPSYTNIYAPIIVNNIAVVGIAGAAGAAGAAGLNVGGFDIVFSPDGKILIDGTLYDIPTGDINLPDGHVINVPDGDSFDFDGTIFQLDPDGWVIDNTFYPDPIGIPETLPLGADTMAYTVYMPTMETIDINRVQIARPDLTSVSDGVSFWWDSAYAVLDDTGLLSILPIVFGLGLLGYVLYRIGG